MRPLPGTCDPLNLNPLADWFTEAGYQHGTYMALLGGVSVVLPPNLVDQR